MQKNTQRKEYIITGLMSGTSLDGLDIACCRFYEREDGNWKYEVLAAGCTPYPADWNWKLKDAHTLPGIELMRLHSAYGAYLGQQVKEFHAQNSLKAGAVASHGHTIFHEPQNRMSFQLGDGAALHAVAGLPVVCNFRALDVALGGQGAPLVPIGDKLLFGQYEFCLNLGGIANISFDNDKGQRLAYDICPCNLLLNRIASKAGKTYDKGGAMAKKGTANQELLQKLDSWDYYRLPYPKSLDKEQLLAALMPLLDGSRLPAEDLLATLSVHTAQQIIKAAEGAALPDRPEKPAMLVTGGGALNTHLTDLLKQQETFKVVLPDRQTIEFKEAIIFAFLGLLRITGRDNALASVTAAAKDSCGGELWGNVSAIT